MIINGNSQLIGDTNPTLPSMSATLEGWFQKLIIGLITKATVNNRTEETITEIETNGVIQPLALEQLEIKPEGQRSWKWYMLHCQPSLSLATDDTAIIKGGRYRVMSRFGYDDYGYIQYELVKDYETVITEAQP
jgi:hypothetical protein